MEEKICKERHEKIDYRLDTHERRLNAHADQLDQLAVDSREYKVQIQNLCKDIASLVSTIRWAGGLLAGALISFFFYAVQQGVFK